MIYFGSSKRGNCVYKCPGFQNEICGGPDSISVYDIRLTDVKLTPPAQTDALVTSTESINSFTEQTAYNKVIDTKSSDGLITSTESNNNFTEQTAYNEAAVKTTIQSTTPNSTMKRTSDITGRRTDGIVSVYISVPVSITIVAALTAGIVFCLMRKCRHTDDQYVLFRRKMVTKNTHLFNSAVNKTYNINTSNDQSNCSKYSSKTVQNSSASLYAEIAFGSTETLETSENGYSTVSIGLLKGKYRKDATESSNTYDTLHTGSKANTIKTSDCYQSVYDHVIVGNHNNQSTDSDEYSHLHTVQINNLQQTYSKVIDNHHIDEDRISDTNSVHCGDQDYKSNHEYDILYDRMPYHT
ncbi:uncharacterized protein LOC123543120 isoform X2 [Mercenaria mercenaria]|uniref:uncharacterized protein LOC123543120 isoform X2 n=1 Tax=Mercenaria mercenaria TaxID=6596 RepID=UPI00234F9186|nr:uncharacterized protein LOC123543120 isoform X2 [Mercenaria mercenaria]